MDSRKPQLKVMGALLSTVLVWVACTAPDGSAPDGSARTASAGIDLAGSDEGHEGHQGTRLYGIDPRLGEHLEIPFESARYWYGDTWIPFSVTLLQGQLMGDVPLTPIDTLIVAREDFNGVRFIVPSALGWVTLSLSQAQPHPNVYDNSLTSNTRWDYQVQWSLDEKGWKNLCPNGASAIVVPYTGQLGNIVPSPASKAFSFACLPQPQTDGSYLGGGVAAKCADWGYSPWNTGDPGPDGLPLAVTFADDQEALRHHVTCTAMATADYCGEGTPHTLDNTSIIMFNTGDVRTTAPVGTPPESYVSNELDGARDNFFFEAAWKVDSEVNQAGQVNHMRAHALCLTKKRWSTLPVGACMSSILPDPRQKGSNATYCEDGSKDKLLEQGALLFSYSMFMDAGLYRFKNSVTGEFLTTADVVIDPNTKYPDSYQPRFAPWKGYKLDEEGSIGSFNPFEGTVLTEAAWNAGPFLNVRSNLRKLVRCVDSNGRYITQMADSWVPKGYSCAPGEGYVYVPGDPMDPMAGVSKLTLWRNGRYVTSVTNLAPLGYSNEGEQGYLPSLVDYAQRLP